MERLLRLIFAPISRLYSRILGWASTDEVFLDTQNVLWIHHLEANWETIRSEYDAFRDNHRLPVITEVLSGEAKIGGERWETLILKFFGKWIDENARAMPRTTALIRDVPGVTSAMVSILAPGQKLTPHYGMFRGVLRYHLGLEVPKPIESCGIRVNGIVRHWELGKSLLFDDTYLHDVWNNSDQPRAVLFMDVKRPLPVPISWLNNFVIFLICRLIMPQMAKIAGAKAVAKS